MSRSRRLVVSLLACASVALFVAAAAAGEPEPDAGMPASMRSWIDGLSPQLRRGAEARLERMPPERRKTLYERWDRMPPERRSQLQERLEERGRRRTAPPGTSSPGSGSPDSGLPGRPRAPATGPRGEKERARFQRQLERWRAMEPGEREQMRQRLERFVTLPAEEQATLIEKRFPDRTPRERARILERMRRAGERVLNPAR